MWALVQALSRSLAPPREFWAHEGGEGSAQPTSSNCGGGRGGKTESLAGNGNVRGSRPGWVIGFVQGQSLPRNEQRGSKLTSIPPLAGLPDCPPARCPIAQLQVTSSSGPHGLHHIALPTPSFTSTLQATLSAVQGRLEALWSQTEHPGSSCCTSTGFPLSLPSLVRPF